MRIIIVNLMKLLFMFLVNTLTGYPKYIEPLNGTNYPSWYNEIYVAIVVCKYDLTLHENKPAEPADANGAATKKRKRCNRMVSMIIK